MPRARATAYAIGLLVLASVAFAACGESAAEKAKGEVCAARAEIGKQINKLKGLTLSSNTVNEAKASFEAIEKELTKIKNAQPKLEGSRKEQVEAATSKFEGELKSITSAATSALSSGSLSSVLTTAGPKVKASLESLATSYRQALGPISC